MMEISNDRIEKALTLYRSYREGYEHYRALEAEFGLDYCIRGLRAAGQDWERSRDACNLKAEAMHEILETLGV